MRSLRTVLLLTPLLARADVVHLDSGEAVEGQVTETDQGVRIALPNGGSIFLPRARVVRIERKPSSADEYLARRKALAPGDVAGMLDLAEWARVRGFELSARKLAAEALAIDPASARAQALLGRVPAGGEFLDPTEAARRGLAPLASGGYGEWDEKYAEDGKALKLTDEAVAQARRTLEAAVAAEPAEGGALLRASGLPARAWTVLLHQRRGPMAGAPPPGLLEDDAFRAWIPEAGGERPCLLALGEGAFDRWKPLAEARGAILLCPAPAEDSWGALDALRKRGVAVDLNRIVVAGEGAGAEAGWRLAASDGGRLAAAVLVSGAEDRSAVPDLSNAGHLNLLALCGSLDPRMRQVRLRAMALMDMRSPIAWREFPDRPDVPEDALSEALDAALKCRRVPCPRRVRLSAAAPARRSWLRLEALQEGAASAQVEAQAVDGNRLFISCRGARRLALDLSDDLLDLSHPVAVLVNGREAFRGDVPPDPALLLERFQAGGDRHVLPCAALAIDVRP